MSSENLQLIGDFLRRKRESLSPEVMGLPKPPRTRTPGLRREDVAAIAGISTVWYSKIERGKAGGISHEALTALSKALRLSPSEKQYLKTLATQEDDVAKQPCMNITSESQRLLTKLNPLPALLINDYFDIIETNQSFNRMCGLDINALPEEERNYIYLTITNPTWQRFLQVSDDKDLAAQLTRMAGFLRSVTASRPNDLTLKARVSRFKELSEVFSYFWNRNTVQQPEQLHSTFAHAELGLITLNKQIWWNFNGDISGRLNIYHSVNEEDYKRLESVI
ncbi:helix-turn-helix domain protein [Photobacterium marinum]|uniref:Helix-turn-helix domain protein n=1 Tax=Photobacterium marinum TaxID=1056511 RepID=L8J6L0_9GAMM|nr:helix-turn-helix transcriptional regulator [Photobacterium marinum]ELR64411.1 helix-turn-helix domain protein [Photobacterium marinum]